MFVYALAGLIGTVHKTIWAYLTKGMFEYRNGSILPPPSTTCTVSALTIVIALRHIDREWKVVLVGGLAGGMLEFAMGLIQQYLLGSRSWNYARTSR